MKHQQILFTFILLVTAFSASAQDECYTKLKEPQSARKNFQGLWTNISLEGTIGHQNQRIQIRFIDARRDESVANKYIVRGKSKVNANICDFSGEIIIGDVFELNAADGDCEGPEYAAGLVKGTYEFREVPGQNHVGIFKGQFTAYWDNHDNIVRAYSGWTTNEGTHDFIGTWQEYSVKDIKYCAWGIQVPPSKNKDLFRPYDNEFYIFNYKFIDKGWKSYVYANLNSWVTIPKVFATGSDRFSEAFIEVDEDEIQAARELEKIEWWK